jgi:competence protein ComEC
MPSVSYKIKVDMIILSHNVKMKIVDLLTIFDCKQIIIDSSNPNYKNSSWKKECENLHIKCYSVIDNGAFQYDF